MFAYAPPANSSTPSSAGAPSQKATTLPAGRQRRGESANDRVETAGCAGPRRGRQTCRRRGAGTYHTHERRPPSPQSPRASTTHRRAAIATESKVAATAVSRVVVVGARKEFPFNSRHSWHRRVRETSAPPSQPPQRNGSRPSCYYENSVGERRRAGAVRTHTFQNFYDHVTRTPLQFDRPLRRTRTTAETTQLQENIYQNLSHIAAIARASCVASRRCRTASPRGILQGKQGPPLRGVPRYLRSRVPSQCADGKGPPVTPGAPGRS